MSKQQTEATKLLSILFPDIQSEIILNKITGYISHKSIRVDIWIPSKNLIIEVMGLQHFKPSGFGKDKIQTHLDFLRQQNRDSNLINICKQFNINYEQIDYTDKIDFQFIYNKFKKYI